MKAYLKNGQTIRISQKIANTIAEEKKAGGYHFITETYKIGKNVKLFIDIREIIAIK